MAKKASKGGYIENNFGADKGCGSSPAPAGGPCRPHFHCQKCYAWLLANPGKILNKPKKKTDAMAADRTLRQVKSELATVRAIAENAGTRLTARIYQLRTELTAALARISALEASANLSASPKPENAPAAKPGSDSAVSELTSEAERLGLYNGPAPDVPLKSSAARPPRVGDVVRYLNDPREWTITRADFGNGNGDNGCAWIRKAPWERGHFTIISEGPDPAAAVVSEREKAAWNAAWNAAIDAADAEFDRWSWYPDSAERRSIRALRK